MLVAAVAWLARQSSCVAVPGGSTIGVSEPVVPFRCRIEMASCVELPTYTCAPSGEMARAVGLSSTRAATQPPDPVLVVEGSPSPTQPSSPIVLGSSGTGVRRPVVGSRCRAATMFDVPAV